MSNIRNTNKFSGTYYDTNHEAFRKEIFLDYMQMFEQKYINRFRFEGDPKLTTAKQRRLFLFAFKHGFSSITDVGKIKDAQTWELLDDDTRKFLEDNKSTNLFDTTRSPLIISPIRYNGDGLIVEGFGIDGPRTNTRRIATKTTIRDSAVLQFNSRYQSGWLFWQVFAYLLATNTTIYKKKLQVADVKILVNSINNNQLQSIYQSIYKVGADLIQINPAQTSYSDNDGTSKTKISAQNLFSTDMQKLDMSNQETLANLTATFNDILSIANKVKGQRSNTHEKKERAITAEFIADAVHFALLEREFKEMVEIFADQYQEIFGIKLTVVDLLDEVAQEFKEPETTDKEESATLNKNEKEGK